MTGRLGEAMQRTALFPAALVLLAALLFVTGAPTGDAFSWPDAPRHALNGAFILDFIRDHPFHDPARYALNYYAKYPALTVLFYPPLFYVWLVPFYAVLGVSQTAALVAEFACYAALALGCFRLARFWLPAVEAFAASAILITAPEIAYWGRQVMLEVPALSLLIWSAVFFVRYQNEKRIPFLYAATALAVLALYVKLTSGFIFIVYLVCLMRTEGMQLFRRRSSYVIAALAIVSTIPLIVLTLKFGQANIQSVGGIPDARVSRASIQGWLWYALRLPGQLGWPALLAAIAGAAAIGMHRQIGRYAFLILWFGLGYLFFSAIDLKEARHSLVLLVPLAILAIVGIQAVLARWPRLVMPAVFVVALSTLLITMLSRPVQYVRGYKEVGDYVASIAPKNSAVVFSGYRDGSFIYAMRTHEERRDLSVVRSDKLFLRVAIRRGLGVKQKIVSEEEIASRLDQLGAAYVVAQPGFWTDLEVMKRLENVLNGPHFERVRTFAMDANYNAQEKELVVYRNLGEVARGPVDLNIELPAIGRKISGAVGNR